MEGKLWNLLKIDYFYSNKFTSGITATLEDPRMSCLGKCITKSVGESKALTLQQIVD